MKFQGKNMVIAGGSNGIGLSLASLFQGLGANIYLITG